MTLHPDEQARERFEAWWWKRHPDYTSELLKRTSKSGAYDSDWVNGMWLAWKAAGQEARLQEWIAAPVHAWPDDGTTYPQKFGAELVKYRNKRIIELEASLRQAAGEGTEKP